MKPQHLRDHAQIPQNKAEIIKTKKPGYSFSEDDYERFRLNCLKIYTDPKYWDEPETEARLNANKRSVKSI